MSTIYRIMGQTGSESSYVEWIVCGFYHKYKAELFVNKLNDWFSKNNTATINPYDKGFININGFVNYFLEEIEI